MDIETYLIMGRLRDSGIYEVAISIIPEGPCLLPMAFNNRNVATRIFENKFSELKNIPLLEIVDRYILVKATKAEILLESKLHKGF